MTIREKLLGMGRYYTDRGFPVPVDLLAEADKYGLSLSDFDQPKVTYDVEQGEDNYGASIKETDIHDL